MLKWFCDLFRRAPEYRWITVQVIADAGTSVNAPKPGKIVNGRARIAVDDNYVFVKTDEDVHFWSSRLGMPSDQGAFDVKTGRDITWGQGRHDLNEYPRLTEESVARVQAVIEAFK